MMNSEAIWSREAEESVISSIFADNSIISDIISILESDDFYSSKHKVIFGIIKKLYENDKKIDRVTVIDFLIKNELLERVGGRSFVFSLSDDYMTFPQNATYHANIIREKSFKRKIIKKSQEIAQKAKEDAEPDTLENISNEIIDITKRIPGNILSVVSLKDSFPDTFEEIKARVEGDGEKKYKTQFSALDKLLLGLERRELFILAGRPSTGKTTLGLNLATNFVKQNIPVLFFSFEMGIDKLNERILAAETRINNNKLKTGNLNNKEIIDITDKYEQINNFPIFFSEDFNPNISEIKKTVREFKKGHSEFIVIIDYLQLIKAKGHNSREQEVADITRQLKILAMKENILVICLAHLNRAMNKRGKKAKPILSDLRESGAIEQDADIVLFLYRDKKQMYSDSNIETTELILAKRRNGETGKTKLSFHKHYTRFDNYNVFD